MSSRREKLQFWLLYICIKSHRSEISHYNVVSVLFIGGTLTLSFGAMWDTEGNLLASMTQQGLLRTTLLTPVPSVNTISESVQEQLSMQDQTNISSNGDKSEHGRGAIRPVFQWSIHPSVCLVFFTFPSFLAGISYLLILKLTFLSVSFYFAIPLMWIWGCLFQHIYLNQTLQKYRNSFFLLIYPMKHAVDQVVEFFFIGQCFSFVE